VKQLKLKGGKKKTKNKSV